MQNDLYKLNLYFLCHYSTAQDGSEQNSQKREQPSAIDILSPGRGGDATLDPTENHGHTLDPTSTESTPKGGTNDVHQKTDNNMTPPSRDSPGPLPEDLPSILDRRYSEPVPVGGAVLCGDEKGEYDRETIHWNLSEQHLVSSSLPNPSSVAIQIEVCCSVVSCYIVHVHA